MVQVIGSVLLGWGGWFSASRLRIPAAAVLGPMVLVGSATALGIAHPQFPPWTKTGLQIIVGAFLGYNVDRTALRSIGSMAGPIALATTWMISSALLIGYLLAVLTRIDLTTAFLATSPGGLAEMSALAMNSQANVALVATLQSFRIISTVVAIPFLVRGISSDQLERGASPKPRQGIPYTSSNVRHAWLVWFVVALVGAVVLLSLQFPAAAIIGSMIAVSIARIAGVQVQRPPQMARTLAQVGLGVLIGASFDNHTMQLLRDELGLVLIVTAATVTSGLGLAGLVERVLHVDRQTALLACAPGGLSQMGIIADEIGAQVFVVNMFHLARLICAVLLLPIIMRLII